MTFVKAVHVNELRQRVDSLRSAACLSPYTYSSLVTPGAFVVSGHITELRTALDQARASLGLTAVSYVDGELSAGMTLLVPHIQQVRDGTR